MGYKVQILTHGLLLDVLLNIKHLLPFIGSQTGTNDVGACCTPWHWKCSFPLHQICLQVALRGPNQ